MEARRFSHKHDLGIRITFTEDEACPGGRETALLAVFDLFVELLQENHFAMLSNNTARILLHPISKINRNDHGKMTGRGQFL